MRMVWRAVAAAALVIPVASSAHCFEQAGERYGVSPQLLRAIARVESGLRAHAVNRQHERRTGSYDIGLMQINSRWLPTLSAYGIDERALVSDPCRNVMVGAWILAGNFARYGAGWEAVGAYNAACTALKGDECARARSRYAWRVYRALGTPSSSSDSAVMSSERRPRLAMLSAVHTTEGWPE